MKNFIFFRTDRLGDFLIITNIIKALKEKYPKSKITVVASQLNYLFIKKYKIIDRVILYNKNYNFLKKIQIFKIINDRNYDASFSVDGKSFSNLCTFFLKSKLKLGLIYKSKIFGFPFYKPNFFFKIIFKYYETFTSKDYLNKKEHLPTKLINLSNNLSLKIKTTDKYYYKPSINEKKFKQEFRKFIKRKFILIHLDEKWLDINGIKESLYEELVIFQKKIKSKIIITSFNNSFDYFVIFKNKLKKKKNKNILLCENKSLEIMERMINYSKFALSCHSGYLVQICGTNKSKIIDIINKKDFIWYSCWLPKNTFHKFVFKSNEREKFAIKKILFDVFKIIKP